MNKIRVLLANHPMMIPDGIRELVAAQEDMELVGDCRGPMKILQETGRTKADAVIIGHAGADRLGLCGQLLAVYPDLTIFGIASDLETVFIQQLCFRRRDIKNLQTNKIVETFRTAVRTACSEEES